MILKKESRNASFSYGLFFIFLSTLATFLPATIAIIPVIKYGEISERSLPSKGRFDVQPEVLFAFMIAGSVYFFLFSFIPMIRSFLRGYYVKFEDGVIKYENMDINIEDIKNIKIENFGLKIIHIHMKNGRTINIPSQFNGKLSKYIENNIVED